MILGRASVYQPAKGGRPPARQEIRHSQGGFVAAVTLRNDGSGRRGDEPVSGARLSPRRRSRLRRRDGPSRPRSAPGRVPESRDIPAKVPGSTGGSTRTRHRAVPARTQPCLGSTSPVPLRVMGMSGTCRSMAIRKAPSLNALTWPSGERVPSGKRRTGTPLASQASQARTMAAMLSLSPRTSGTYRLSRMFQPMKGMPEIALLRHPLEGPPETEQDQDVGERGVVGDQDGAAAPGQVLPPLHPQAPEGVAPEEELAPEACVKMKGAAVAVEGERHQPDHHRAEEEWDAAQGEVGPEERGEGGAHRGGGSALLRRAGHDAGRP